MPAKQRSSQHTEKQHSSYIQMSTTLQMPQTILLNSAQLTVGSL